MLKKGYVLVFLFIASLSSVACGYIKKTEGIKEPKWQLAVDYETIEVEGLEREYNFLFLTDSHLIIPGVEDTEEVKEYSEQRLKEFNVENSMDSDMVPEQFSIWIQDVNQNGIDAFLLGGDIIDYPSDANLNYLQENLKLLKVPYLYTLGNHDWTYPWDYMTQYGIENYIPQLAPFMDSNAPIHYLEYEDLVLVAIDNSTNQIHPNALEEYEKILKKEKPVIVMLHVPLLTQSALTKAKEIWSSPVILGGGNYGGIYPDESSTKFMEMTTSNDSPVVAVLAGHAHFHDRDMVNEKIVQIVGDAGFKGKATLIQIKSMK